MDENLKLLTGSETRTNILLALRDGPKNLPELVLALGVRDTTVSHSLKPLVDARIVEAPPRGQYSLTAIGQAKAILLGSMLTGLATLEENSSFWASHDLSSIPQELLVRVGQLSGGVVMRDEPPTIWAAQNAFIDAVSKATHFWGVSPILGPGYEEMILGLLARGAEVNLILTDSVFKQIDKESLETAMSYQGFNLYTIEDGVKVAFTVTDSLVSIALFNPDGSYDPSEDLICESPAAVEWGRSLFERFLRSAKLIEYSSGGNHGGA